jgi:hypothetical protein
MTGMRDNAPACTYGLHPAERTRFSPGAEGRGWLGSEAAACQAILAILAVLGPVTRTSFLAVKCLTDLPQKEILESTLEIKGAGLIRIARPGEPRRPPSVIVSFTAADREALEWRRPALGRGKSG